MRRQFEAEAGRLLQACNVARQDGADFPTIWHEILKTNRLVTGPPIQHVDESGPILEVQLITGQQIVYGTRGFSIR